MRYLVALALGCGILAACGNPLGLPPAAIPNAVDTVHLYALSGTPVTQPSGYSIPARHAIRTELSSSFDFAFDIDTAGRALLYPTGALKMGRLSGIQLSAQDFDSIKFAPTTSYHLDSAQVVTENAVLILHSAPVSCSFGIASVYYAKLHVLTIDTTSGPDGRRIDFEILNDINCGYRGLEPGLPRH
jgi:hypothetical protein